MDLAEIPLFILGSLKTSTTFIEWYCRQEITENSHEFQFERHRPAKILAGQWLRAGVADVWIARSQGRSRGAIEKQSETTRLLLLSRWCPDAPS